jgi:hypothetical protein
MSSREEFIIPHEEERDLNRSSSIPRTVLIERLRRAKPMRKSTQRILTSKTLENDNLGDRKRSGNVQLRFI